MKFRKRLESMLNKMSYTARRTYAVTKYTEKCNRYLLMDEPEFLMDYIEAIAKYHESKFTFIASEFSTIAILFVSLYKYIFFVRKGVETAQFSKGEIDVIMNVSVIVTAMIFVSACFVFWQISQRRYRKFKEKIFMEEVKKMREEKRRNG